MIDVWVGKEQKRRRDQQPVLTKKEGACALVSPIRKPDKTPKSPKNIRDFPHNAPIRRHYSAHFCFLTLGTEDANVAAEIEVTAERSEIL